MSFSQALSGLAAQSENLKVVSNNIANSQTVGFKSGNVAFSDVFAGATSKVGLGTSVAAITQDFTSGDLENTGRNLDLAVAGEGFYRLEKPTGETVFSRNGQFSQDADGFLVNANGQQLTGYGLTDPNDAFSDVVVGGAPEALRIPMDDIPANATTEVNATYNLDAGNIPGEGLQTATVVDGAGDDAEDVDINYHYSNSFTVYDSLGNSQIVSTYFEKDGENSWTARMAVNGQALGGGDPTEYTVTFNENGQLVAGEGDVDENGNIADIVFDSGAFFGGEPEDLEWDFNLAGTTQFSNSSVQNTLSQDGYTSGSLVGVEVLEDGTIMRNYTNEESRAAGQLVLSTFANVEGLQPDGDNGWRATNASGEPVLGVAGTGMFGTVASGVLENSNVDLAKQLVDMIVAQRAYQANSSSISTQDELLQTVINL